LSLPLAAGLPPLRRKKGGVCSLRQPASYYPLFYRFTRITTGHSLLKAFLAKTCGQAPVANPSLNGSKGKEQPPAVAVGREVEKNTTIHVCVFSFPKWRPCHSTALSPQQAVVCPPCFSSCHQTHRSSPHGKGKVIPYPNAP